MSLNEFIVEEAALTWSLLCQCFGGLVGELGYAVGHESEMAPYDIALNKEDE